MRIAIGPQSHLTSWTWIGADIATRLAARAEIICFKRGEVARADVVLIVKDLIALHQHANPRNDKSKLIYLPVDRFHSLRHLESRISDLQQCDLLLVHSSGLIPYLTQFARVSYIDHYGKFFLPELAEYRQSGYILWIGAIENLPFLLHYLKSHRLPLKTKALTDLDNPIGRSVACKLARRFGMTFEHERGGGEDLEILPWSPRLQSQMMAEAKAAIDIKGNGFNQQLKPPTKAQQFICSGIPLAMNVCDAVAYFEDHGLSIADPTEPRWLSREYHNEIRAVATRLRPRLTLESVTRDYWRAIQMVLGDTSRLSSPFCV
jgi:hypothetical protein